MISECSARELQQYVQEEKSFFLFVYTPLCGTCKLTARMLDIIMQMAPQLDVRSCNINLAPELAAAWKLESVPCVLWIERGTPLKRIYRIQSVDGLYQWMNNTISEGEMTHE